MNSTMEDETADNPALTTPASHQLSNGHVPDHRHEANSDPKTVPRRSIVVSKYDRSWRRIVRNFSPSWFSVTMVSMAGTNATTQGTGIVANLFFLIPYKARWLYWLSIVFFGLNTTLFSLAFLISLVRYGLYPEIWVVMVNDPNNSLFLGTVPMGFATLLQMIVNVCVPSWGPWTVTFVWSLWIIDSIVAVAVTILLCFTHLSSPGEVSLSSITAAQLLPVAASIVAAGTGARIAEVLPDPQRALATLLASYTMWGIGTPLALTIMVMYYQRLAIHKLPPREVLVSCFLPLGPLGFGGYSIMYLGKVSQVVFPMTKSLHVTAGDFLYVQGFLIALILWSFGLVWFVFAFATIYKGRPIPFNMGWWGFTFPLGVYASSTIQLGLELPSRFFRVLGTVFAVMVIILWAIVAAGTVRGAWSGRLFVAPCLARLKEEDVRKGDIGTSEEVAEVKES